MRKNHKTFPWKRQQRKSRKKVAVGIGLAVVGAAIMGSITKNQDKS